MAVQKVDTSRLEKELGFILTQIQDAVEKAMVPLQRGPLNGGVLLKNVVLLAGKDNLVRHTLGRIPVVFFTGIPNAQSQIWNPISAALANQASSTVFLNLWCSANCTINVWVN